MSIHDQGFPFNKPRQKKLSLNDRVLKLLALILGGILLLIGAIIFFNNNGSNNIILVTADNTAFKTKPVEEGGIKIPNLDKTIYEANINNNSPQIIVAEPEKPITRNKKTSLTTPVKKLVHPKKKPENKSVFYTPKAKKISVSKALENKMDNIHIILGYYKNAYDATKAWEKSKVSFKDSEVSSYGLRVTRNPDGRYTLETGNVANRKKAIDICKKLKKQGTQCTFKTRVQ